MDKSQARFLAKRWRIAVAQNPALVELRKVLLMHGGLEVVAPAPPPGDMEGTLYAAVSQTLATFGVLMQGQVKFEEMDRSRCHHNVSALWREVAHYGLVGIGHGYGLSDDGLWREHSWGVLRDGRLLETTQVREKYFGLLLEGQFADDFAGVENPI